MNTFEKKTPDHAKEKYNITAGYISNPDLYWCTGNNYSRSMEAER
jgi:hypothetical protein